MAGEVRLCSRSEGRRLLVPHGDPSKLVLSPDGVGDPVERVSRNSIDPRHPSADEGSHEQFRDRLLSHGILSCFRPCPLPDTPDRQAIRAVYGRMNPESRRPTPPVTGYNSICTDTAPRWRPMNRRSFLARAATL